MKPCFLTSIEVLQNVADNPDFEVVLENECPIQRAEEEIEITNVVKASGDIIKKRKINFSKEEECTILGKQMLTNESIKTVSKHLWFPKHSYREAPRV